MKWIFGSGLLAVLAAGCVAEDTTLDPADYDRSCTTKDECVLVLVGDQCEASCEEAAINASDLDRFVRDRDAIVCPGAAPEWWICGGGTEAWCIDGLCVAY